MQNILLGISIVIIICLCRWLYVVEEKKAAEYDHAQFNKNMYTILCMARWEYKNGMLDKEIWDCIIYMCHPSFKSIFDYMPPERVDHDKKMRDYYDGFFREYKLTPDFKIDIHYVYSLFIAYLYERIQNDNAMGSH